MFYSAKRWSTVEAVLAPFRLHPKGTAFDDCLADQCIEYARENGVLALVADRLASSGVLSQIEEGPRRLLCDALSGAKASVAPTRAARIEILETLEREAVPVLVLKGGALSEMLYDRPGTRQTRDLDILVPPSSAERARAVLERLGFAALPGSEEPGHHLPRMVRRRTSAHGVFAVDVHHQLVPKCIYGFRLGEMKGLWERAVLLELAPGHAVRTLSRRDHVIHLHLHLFHHVFYNFRLMHLLDIVFIARRWTDLAWGEIAEELTSIGLQAFRSDLWSWIAGFFGDSLNGASPPDARSLALGTWILQHGSLPIFSPLGYSKNAAEWTAAFPRECRRYIFRTLRAPGWRPFSEVHR